MTDATELAALLPCPLCGKDDPIFELIHAHTHHVAVFMPDYPGACVISCGQCGCAIMCEGEASQDDAFKRWNTRALASRDGVPEGWVCVPVVPSNQMWNAGDMALAKVNACCGHSDASAVYAAMLKAAPPPPAVGDQVVTKPDT